MKKLLVCVAFTVLAACGAQEAPEPQPTPTATVAAPVIEPSLPAPDEAVFAEIYAEACPNAPKVSTSLCRSKGMGEQGFNCDYGLGKDEYRRNKASLEPGDGKWTLVDPENTCTAA